MELASGGVDPTGRVDAARSTAAAADDRDRLRPDTGTQRPVQTDYRAHALGPLPSGHRGL
jgi:hypothetical protein